jgi:hypothetical protein
MIVFHNSQPVLIAIDRDNEFLLHFLVHFTIKVIHYFGRIIVRKYIKVGQTEKWTQ